GEHSDGRRIARMHDVASIDLAKADAPVHRRGDGSEAQLCLRALDPRLISLDGSLEIVDLGLLLIDCLLRAGPLVHQVLETFQVFLIRDELRLILGALCLGLIERGNERTLIDDGERVALLDLLALDEINAGELAVDLAADGDGVRGLHRTESVEIDRHIAGRDLCCGDRHWRGLWLWRGVVRRRALQYEGRAEDQGHNAESP